MSRRPAIVPCTRPGEEVSAARTPHIPPMEQALTTQPGQGPPHSRPGTQASSQPAPYTPAAPPHAGPKSRSGRPGWMRLAAWRQGATPAPAHRAAGRGRMKRGRDVGDCLQGPNAPAVQCMVRTWCCSASTAPLPSKTSQVRTVLRSRGQAGPQAAHGSRPWRLHPPAPPHGHPVSPGLHTHTHTHTCPKTRRPAGARWRQTAGPPLGPRAPPAHPAGGRS